MASPPRQDPRAVAGAFGPGNPHPLSTLKTELVWEGKYDEFGNQRAVDSAGLTMPLQRIETVDEPRARTEAQGGLFDTHRAHLDDFRNMLLWGDNKLVAASLLRDLRASVGLIYIDPPFDVGADFTMDIAIGEGVESVEKDQSALEMVAYRDTWGRGTDSYVHMMYERISLMRDLLTESGSLFVHCDWRMSSFLRLVLADVFGAECFRNEIVWQRTTNTGSSKGRANKLSNDTDSILYFGKTPNPTFVKQYRPYSQDYLARFKFEDETGRYRWQYMATYSEEKLKELQRKGEVRWPEGSKNPEYKQYLKDLKGIPLNNLWADIFHINPMADENLGYATQKPEALVERIIRLATDESDIVADLFCGSGTTGAVAERLRRRWVMADLGRFAIHTSRKRMIEVQRELHSSGNPYRAFDVFNLGRYERQWWQRERLKGADDEHRRVVLEFYKAEPLARSPSPVLHGRKGPSFCHVDGIDSIFSRGEAKAVATATKEAGGKEVACLAWEFEMDLRMVCDAFERELGVRIKLIQIPREIMEKNRKEPPPFLEVATLEAEPVFRTADGKRTVDIKLKRFIPSLAEVPTKELEALQERAMKSGFDFIDFWAVDFDFHNGGPFNHHWQDYRTRKDRSLKTVSEQAYVYAKKGRYTACVKVVDIFGCDTSISVPVEYV